MSQTELPPLPDDVARLLREAAAPMPPPGFHDAVRARVTTTLGVYASVSALGKWGLGLSGGTLVVGLISGILLAPLLRPAPVVVVVPHQAPVLVAPPAPQGESRAPVAPQPHGEARVPVAVPPAPRVEAPGPVVAPVPEKPPVPTRDFELADERAAVDMARSALARGEPAQALLAIDALAKRLPRGQLAEERESLAVEALMAAGQVEEAKARAAKFRADFPQSMLLPAVDAALEGR